MSGALRLSSTLKDQRLVNTISQEVSQIRDLINRRSTATQRPQSSEKAQAVSIPLVSIPPAPLARRPPTTDEQTRDNQLLANLKQLDNRPVGVNRLTVEAQIKIERAQILINKGVYSVSSGFIREAIRSLEFIDELTNSNANAVTIQRLQTDQQRLLNFHRRQQSNN